MKKVIAVSLICTLVVASSVFAGNIIGSHKLSNDRGLVTVKSIEGNKMAVDIIYVPVKGNLIILTDVFVDYDSQTQKAVYSEDRFCPDALKMTFQDNGKVVIREATCAEF